MVEKCTQLCFSTPFLLSRILRDNQLFFWLTTRNNTQIRNLEIIPHLYCYRNRMIEETLSIFSFLNKREFLFKEIPLNITCTAINLDSQHFYINLNSQIAKDCIVVNYYDIWYKVYYEISKKSFLNISSVFFFNLSCNNIQSLEN